MISFCDKKPWHSGIFDVRLEGFHEDSHYSYIRHGTLVHVININSMHAITINSMHACLLISEMSKAYHIIVFVNYVRLSQI